MVQKRTDIQTFTLQITCNENQIIIIILFL